MGENTVFVRRYAADDAALAVNEREIWRYAGCRGIPAEDDPLRERLRAVRKELEGAFRYQVCFRRLNVAELPFTAESRDLSRCLRGSETAVLFAATVGMEIDRRMARARHTDSVKALLMQACGTERVEALCNRFCAELRQEFARSGMECTPRFSPGYGDFPLNRQQDFFRLLEPARHIGVTLNESLLMSPTKSVTAIFGAGKNICVERTGNCERCGKTDCAYRRTDERSSARATVIG